jgi:hypothetical protein
METVVQVLVGVAGTVAATVLTAVILHRLRISKDGSPFSAPTPGLASCPPTGGAAENGVPAPTSGRARQEETTRQPTADLPTAPSENPRPHPKKARLQIVFSGDSYFGARPAICYLSSSYTYQYEHAEVKIDGRKVGSGDLLNGFKMETELQSGEHLLLLSWQVHCSEVPDWCSLGIGKSNIEKRELKFTIGEPGNYILHLGSDEGTFRLSQLDFEMVTV